jgi:hypothetical protein
MIDGITGRVCDPQPRRRRDPQLRIHHVGVVAAQVPTG